MHKPLGIIKIKYLLSTKSLLQSLNLVHLQFLEQRTDLGIKRVGRGGKKKGRNSKKYMHEYLKSLQLWIQPKATVAGKFNLEALCSYLNKEDYASNLVDNYI